MIRTIHPFPARMAPELAVTELRSLNPKSVVLDPMSGSGTVLREAVELGHQAIGFDLDPLSVLMAKVWSTPVCGQTVTDLAADVVYQARQLKANDLTLPWIDHDKETENFVNFWFASIQRDDLRCLAFMLARLQRDASSPDAKAAVDALSLALSRIIVTKENGASLARDTSHSRPHKVSEVSDYQVFNGFEKSVRSLCSRLAAFPSPHSAQVYLGDARRLTPIQDSSIDAVLTSPPYLNAIDYLRGHRLSLVWLGYGLSELRAIKRSSIGAERGLDDKSVANPVKEILNEMGEVQNLPTRCASMVTRYAHDIYHLLAEISRILKATGRAIFVIGNSCLKGTFIKNSSAIIKAATMNGLRVSSEVERGLPVQNRYLPTPTLNNTPLGKRIRTETILTLMPA